MNRFMKWLMKPKYIVKVLIEKDEGYEVVFTKTVRSPKDKIRYGKRSYIVDWEHPCYTSYNMKFYHMNFESGKYIAFTESKFGANPKGVDKIVATNVIERLARGVMNLKKEKIMYFILGCIMGALLGAIIMSEYKNQTITELYERLENTNPVIFDMIRMSVRLL